MKRQFWLWTRPGSETSFSGRQPSNEYAAALKRDGWLIFTGVAHLPAFLETADAEVKVTMERNLTPGSMPAVNGGAK